MKKRLATAFLLAVLLVNASAATESLDKLANDFWAWRAKYAPFTGDDVNRIERPGGTRDWSRASIDKQRKDLAEFEASWKKLDPTQWAVPQQVDYRLTGSALARVRWELEINPRWKHDPNFYIAQTLTAVVEALTVPGPYDDRGAGKFSRESKTFRRSCSRASRILISRLRHSPLLRSKPSKIFGRTCVKWRQPC